MSQTQRSSSSQSRSRSYTPTRTPSGFPLRNVIDNTDSLLNYVADTYSLLTPSDWGGIVIFWPEADPQCGPGSYDLLSVYLPLTAFAE